MPSAMRRRSPVTLISVVPVRRVRAGPALATAPPPATWASRSARVMRPAGPLPATEVRSTPASRALMRTAGLASGRSPGTRGVTGAGGAAATGAGAGAAAGAEAASGSDAGAAASVADALPFPSTSNSMHIAPTGRMSPTSPTRLTTTPLTGEGISTVALSVMTDRMGWSSVTVSPTATIHSTTSPSTTPSPMSGSLNA
jgi:hypothetical protein